MFKGSCFQYSQKNIFSAINLLKKLFQTYFEIWINYVIWGAQLSRKNISFDKLGILTQPAWPPSLEVGTPTKKNDVYFAF